MQNLSRSYKKLRIVAISAAVAGAFSQIVFAQATDSDRIAAMIDKAIADGTRTVVIGKNSARTDGKWMIGKAIKLPSDFKLVLDGCYLQMEEGSFCNMFINKNAYEPIGRTAKGTDRNIEIIGKNGAVMDGGVYNGLHEKNAMREGRPPIWVNNLLLFANVEGFKVTGIECRNQRWWALNFLYSCKGKISDVKFRSDCSWTNQMGEVSYGFNENTPYWGIRVKNSDGVDIRSGCYDIDIENISGFTQDDSVALTALNGAVEKRFFVEGRGHAISNITVRNVTCSSDCSQVRILAQGLGSISNILVDGVTDTSALRPEHLRGWYSVRIGDSHRYGNRQPTGEEFRDITVRNVNSRARRAAVLIACPAKNQKIDNVTAFDGCPAAIYCDFAK